MKKLTPIALLLICATVYAEPVARYDVATNDFIGCQSISDSRIWLNDQNDVTTAKAGYLYISNGCGSLPQLAVKYLRHSAGVIVEKSQAEKDAIDLAEAQAAEVSYRTGQKANFDGASGVYLRALVKVLLDEINILRSNAGLQPRTLAQAKTAIQNKVDDGSVDEP